MCCDDREHHVGLKIDLENGTMMRLGGAVILLTLLSGAALADDARRLRIEAGALVQESETADSARERRALLKRAHGKLLEIRERFPDQPVRVNLYLDGKRVSLSPDDVAAMIAAAPLADLDVGKLREVIGRQLSPTAADENGWTDLHWAAALNLPELAEALLALGADVTAPLKDDVEPISERLKRSLSDLERDPGWVRSGERPTHIAAWENALEVMEVLIAAGADIHAKSNWDLTALHFAAENNAQEVAAALIAEGADIHAKDFFGFTPLHSAVWGNAREVAAVLIAAGANIHAKDDSGSTLLHSAAAKNARDAAEALIAAGANIHAKDNSGSTPLHSAAAENAQDTAEALVAAGADIHAKDNNGRMPLAVALERNADAISTYLRERQKSMEDRLAGLDVGNLREILGRELSPTEADENGWTDLHWAAALNLPEMAATLLDTGADVSVRLKDDGVPLSDRLRKALNDLGVSQEFEDFNRTGEQPLHITAFADAREVAAVLVERGADPSFAGEPPLYIAAFANAHEVAAVLIGAGADVHGNNYGGFTPLHIAAWNSAREVAAALIIAGADIHAKGPSGQQPLHEAALHNAHEVAAVLIGADADIHAKDSGGYTPLHRAATENAQEVAGALIAAGADVHAKSTAGLDTAAPCCREQCSRGCGGVDCRRRRRSREGPWGLHTAAPRCHGECPGGYGGVDCRWR